MCGLVGFIGNSSQKNLEAFNYLLYFDYLRGPHSTGVAAINSKDPKYLPYIEVFKSLGGPWDFYAKHKKDFVKGMYKGQSNIMIGHNRFATQGKITEGNAHPFQLGDITGAHNGTVSQWSLRDFTGYKEYDIDSQIILNELNTKSIQEVWDKADGAIALTYFDSRDETMNIVRNDKRTLYVAPSKDGKTVFWASEDWMLEVSAGKAGVELGDVQLVPVDTHFKFEVGKDKIEWERKTLKPFKPAKVIYDFSNYVRPEYVPVFSDNHLLKFEITGWDEVNNCYTGVGKNLYPVDIRIVINNDGEEENETDRLEFYLKQEPKSVLCLPYTKSTHVSGRLAGKKDHKVVSSHWVRPFISGQMEYIYKEVLQAEKDRKNPSSEEYVYIFDGINVNIDGWNKYASDGCSCCGNPVPWEFAKTAEWSVRELVCESCQKDIADDHWLADVFPDEFVEKMKRKHNA